MSEAKDYARSRMDAWGFGGQFDSLDKLWQRESGWNPNARNKSGASGIPQLKGGSNVPGYDSDYRVQVEHGLSYIKNRYGNPDNAWKSFQKKGWY